MPRQLRVAQPTPDAFFDVPLYLASGHVVEQLRRTALDLGEDPLASQAMLARRIRHRLQPATRDELAAAVPAPDAFWFLFDGPSMERTVEDGIAIVRVVGTLYRGMFWDDYAVLRARIDEAMEDSRVRAVLLDIDSPGGRVAGCFDLTRHIRALVDEEVKPIWALANDVATSAACAIGTAAGRFYVTPSGMVGSIGAIVQHVDTSKAEEEYGYKFTEVASGERKTDLSPHKPLNRPGRELLAEMVEAAAEQFFLEVSSYRDIPVDELRAMQAAIYVGVGGQAVGLCDDVASRDEVLELLRQELGSSASAARVGPMFSSEPANSAASAAGGTDMADQRPAPGGDAPANTPTPAAQPPAPPPAPAPAPVAIAAPPAPDPEVAMRERAQLIVSACQLSGRPELAGQMIADGLSIGAAQARLLELRAATDGGTIVGTPAQSGFVQPTIDVAAVHRRWSDPKALMQHASATRGVR